MPTALVESLRALQPAYSGKVREVYRLDDRRLLLVTSSRVSAYDVVFPEPVPDKGAVLNLMSAWWFARTASIVPNHLLETRADRIFPPGSEDARTLRGRVALVRQTDPIRYECVVRGFLDGSAWREYEASGTVAGNALPAGLKRYDPLPRPLFTPATKAESGHDINITVAQMAEEFGAEATAELERISLALYRFAADEVRERGLLLLDTKFEFGRAEDGTLLLIDEIFTPDSSRYRWQDGAGGSNGDGGATLALDKQYLRDWLAAHGFTGEGDPPPLPPEVLDELARRYRQAFELVTGEPLARALEEKG